jgi:hypothetical protein
MAKEILKYMKKIIITLFIFCFLEFIALVIMTILYIRLNNDIGVIETTTQEVQQDNTNGDNNFIGRDGDIYGKANN